MPTTTLSPSRLAALQKTVPASAATPARVLFTGGNAGAKRTAARALATAAGRDLVRVDLSPVSSQYIGETEKNIRQLLARAERTEAVLLLDEADALFGRRSSVSDSHDRYGNLEVNYLLQRIERHPGVVLLAVTRRRDLRADVSRYFAQAVTFPAPPPPEP